MQKKKIFKITSLVMLLATTTIFNFVQPVTAKTNSTAITKNLTTDVITTTTLSDSDSEDNSSTTSSAVTVPTKVNSSLGVQTIIGSDDRTQVTDTTDDPYSAICYLQSTFPDGTKIYGTAWIYKRNVAATAGHCIYNNDHGGWAKTVTVWPGRKDGYIPYGSASSTEITVSNDWKDDADSNYDWGVIKLDSNIGNNCYNLDSINTATLQLTRHEMTLAGYPSDHPGEMWKASGNISSYTNYKINYPIDMLPGDSGAPIFYEGTTGSGKHYWTVAGINTTETSSENHGVRTTEDFVNVLRKTYQGEM